MKNFVLFILLFILFYIYDEGLSRIVESHYCKKNKGICKNCSCWSCEKHH